MQNIQGDLPQLGHIYVSPDGHADYKTIQEAVNSVPEHNGSEVMIHIGAGIYEEKVEISESRPYITMIGDSAENTEITFANYAGKLMENGDVFSTFRSATVTIYASHFTAKNISFRNSYDGSLSGGKQALAVYASGEHISFERCSFYGAQDTLYAKDGTQYYDHCFISGDVDYIFGGARAFFEECELNCKNSVPDDENKSSYITAPSTPMSQPFGLIFYKCRVTGEFAEGHVYLGRPWHPGASPQALGNCLFMECELPAMVNEAGWKEHMGGFLSVNARLYEFNNYGEGVKTHERRKHLTAEEAAFYTKERVLGIY